jgi:PKD repeat protein
MKHWKLIVVALVLALALRQLAFALVTFNFGGGCSSPLTAVTITGSPTVGPTTLVTSFAATPIGGAGLTYDWNFGDGTAHGTTQNPTHNYTVAGTYTASLTVTDSLSNVRTAVKTVLVTGATYYVSQATGNNSNSGLTPSLPFLTLGQCQTSMRASGTIKTCTIIDSLTYTLNANFLFTTSDNNEQWVTSFGLSSKPTIDGNGGLWTIANTGGTNIGFYGFKFNNLFGSSSNVNYPFWGVSSSGGNMTLRWNAFTNCNKVCTKMTGTNGGLIDSNTFSGILPATTTASFFNSSINGENAVSNLTVSHNRCDASVAAQTGGCVSLGTAGGAGNEMSNVLVTKNYADHNLSSSFDSGTFYFYDPAGGSTGIVYSYNKCFNNNGSAAGQQTACYYEDQGASNVDLIGNIGAQCGDWCLKMSCPISGTDEAHYNIFDGTANTASFGGTMFGASAFNCGAIHVNHDIVVDFNGSWWNYFWMVEASPTVALPTVTTNQWYSPAGNAPTSFGIYFGGSNANIPNTNPFNGDPLFTNRAGLDYSLQPTSPAFTNLGWTALPTDQGPVNSPFQSAGGAF